MNKWWDKILFNGNKTICDNPPPGKLIEISLRQNSNNQLSANGSLVVATGKFTGRAIDDKYVVLDENSSDIIDWENGIRKMSPETFENLKTEIIEKFNSSDSTGIPIFTMEQSVGANAQYTLGVRVITPSASHALFCQNIFREKVATPALGNFLIYHDPSFVPSACKQSLHSPTVIAINFNSCEIIIVGTGYAGEIKKSIFSVMNTLLPDFNVLPMHTGANQDKNGNTSLFFGLSGTGKTTLSTDEGTDLIGDDEHGLSDQGIFNFEGGCYAKTYGLKFEKEPVIFNISNNFKTLLENVVLDPTTRLPNYDDKRLTENGRSTYSLDLLPNVVKSGTGPRPSHIFFLSADALGVLPAISCLTSEQAMYYFLSGYTAKLAGTEVGLKGIKTTFSHCFGAPFMLRKRHVYGDLLKKFLDNYPTQVWLVNTGWYGGPYGEGQRYTLDFTRSCIRAVQQGLATHSEFIKDPTFSLAIPQNLGNLDPHFMNPIDLWTDKAKYLEIALNLKQQFEANFNR